MTRLSEPRYRLDPDRLDRMIDHALNRPQETPADLRADIRGLRWRRPAVWAGLPALAASFWLIWMFVPASPAALQTADYAELSDLLMMELVDEL